MAAQPDKPPAKTGRPSAFSPELQERICLLIRSGNTLEISAQAVGLNPHTLYKWVQRRPRFRDAVEQARAEAEAMLVGRVQKAAQVGSWRAACWLLERQWPERWAALPDREKADPGLDQALDRILAETD